MKIAIHHKEHDFSSKWIEYCDNNRIDYKIVNCYQNNIIEQLDDCDALMWHFHHQNPKDVLFAKELLYSLQIGGKVVFPDFKTAWHFDDKLGQKYLLESIGAPLVPSYVFYDKQKALEWTEQTMFPKVFKLRCGSGSSHVQLVENQKKAQNLIRKAFGRGFKQYNPLFSLKERWRKYRIDKANLSEVAKGVVRFIYPTEFSKVAGKERGYIYFQDFVPGNSCDMRINIVFDKCFGSIRNVRSGDFRASGSGIIANYDSKKIPSEVVKIAFNIAQTLNLQSVAFDFIMKDTKPVVIEMSYGFGVDVENFDYGYWEPDLKFVETKFNPFGWMVEGVIDRVKAYDKKRILNDPDALEMFTYND